MSASPIVAMNEEYINDPCRSVNNESVSSLATSENSLYFRDMDEFDRVCNTGTEIDHTLDSDNQTYAKRFDNRTNLNTEGKDQLQTCVSNSLTKALVLRETDKNNETKKTECNGHVCSSNGHGTITNSGILRNGQTCNTVDSGNLTVIKRAVINYYSERNHGNGCQASFGNGENAIDTSNEGILCTKSLAVLSVNLHWEATKTLCRVLGVKDNKVRDIDMEKTTSADKTFSGLTVWTDNYEGDLKTQEKEFIESFKTIGRMDIAQTLQKVLSEKRILQESDFSERTN